ncbi:MAG: class I poly(R)-hydroxyalkanoic acid synthase, partial [Novosphingobium sp.]|nr:class I poly(R)-hydroxyalkanoic acid synthase [Novosphingobium sp.]
MAVYESSTALAHAARGISFRISARGEFQRMAGKPGEDQGTDWAELIRGLQAAWNKACATAPGRNAQAPSFYTDPANLAAMAQGLLGDLSLASGDQSKQLWEEALQLIECVLGHYGIGPRAQSPQDPRPGLPRSDPRFADPAWRKSPLFALLHQLWLMLAERLPATVASMEKLAPERRQRALFGLRILLEALNPANFPLTNPLVLDRAVKTGGESLLRGLTQLLADLGRGRLTHSDPRAFVLGETIATTPGMVIHQTPLFQLIQYVPVTERVMRTPLVIFPAWINRYYILDIDARKSLVRWALTQGFSVFMVSWKSADESLSGIIWDDYIAAQIEVIEHVRQRLRVPAVHVVGHCVAGTTLAATLAVMARRGNASCVRSATFLTAQVDFSEAGDLACLADDRMIEALGRLAPHGLVDGRYLAATFNL